jgi:hypothetical protein
MKVRQFGRGDAEMEQGKAERVAIVSPFVGDTCDNSPSWPQPCDDVLEVRQCQPAMVGAGPVKAA